MGLLGNFLPKLALAALLAGAPLYPAEADPIARAEALLADREPAQALALLDGVTPATPSELARLTWVRAVAHLQRREFRAALPLLEKLVSAAPNETRFRLELGRALFEIGEDDRARHHLTLARSSGISDGESRAVEQYFQAMTRRQVTTRTFTFGIAPSSNPGERTSARVVMIAGMPFVLSPDARARAGTALKFGMGVVTRPSLGRDLRGRFSLSGTAEAYDTGARSSFTLVGEAGLEWLGDRDRITGAGVSVLRKIAEGRGDYTRVGLYFSHAATLGRAGAVSARFELGDQNYDASTATDGRRARLWAQYRHSISPRFQVQVTGELEKLDAEARHEAFDRVSLGVGATYGFEGGLVLGVDITQAQVRYDGFHPIFAVRRRDDITTIGARLYHRNVQLRGFAPVLNLSFENADSTSAFHAYDNTTVSIGLTRSF